MNVIEHSPGTLDEAWREVFVLDIVDAEFCHIEGDTEAVCQRAMEPLIPRTLVLRDHRDSSGYVCLHRIPRNHNLSVIEGRAEVVNGVTWEAFSHGGDDKLTVTFTEQACLGNGLAVLQRRTQINAAQQSSFWNVGRDFSQSRLS